MAQIDEPGQQMTTATADNVTTTPRPERKLASRVADRIIRDITRDGWQTGTVIGSEAQLLERYDVSRAVFRESVRLLEHLGVVVTRRGPGGGLVVTEPSTSSVVQAFLVYLTYTDLAFGDIMDARISLERSIARLATERADEFQIATLRARVEADEQRRQLDATDHHVLHTMIGTAARNPAATLFIDVLGRLTARWSYPPVDAEEQREALDASARAHLAIVDAITAGDTALAERRMTAHLSALNAWLSEHPARPRPVDWVLDHESGDEKLGTKVARSIIVDIIEHGWPIGEVLGSEVELTAKYQVSRATIREAVRLLEYHEVVTMKRGPGGGLVVTSPSIEPIVRTATVFLERRSITSGDLIAIRRDIESDAVALAAVRASAEEIAGLRSTLQTEADAGFHTPIADEFHVRIAQLTGNAAMTLFVSVLVELSRRHASVPQRESQARTAMDAETDQAHRAIVAALEDRDIPLARRRITKHLTALEPLLR